MSEFSALIVDDSSFFRKMLTDLCQQLGIAVIQTFDSAEELMGHVEAHLEQAVDKYLLFLDINMPGKSGVDILPDLLDAWPEVIVIMASTLKEKDLIEASLKEGASNYISKDASPDQIKNIILQTIQLYQ